MGPARAMVLRLAVALVATAFAFSASAQGVPNTGTGKAAVVVVNVELLLQQSLAARSIQRQLDGMKDQVQREIGQQQERLRQSEQELARLRQTLSAEDFDRKRGEFETLVTTTSRATQERTRKMDVALNNARNTLVEMIRTLVGEVARERGASLVISSQFILYQADKSVEITDAVLQRLDTRLPEITVTIPQ